MAKKVDKSQIMGNGENNCYEDTGVKVEYK